MPTGPKGEKRPADVIDNAVCVMQIATGEAEEDMSGSLKWMKPPQRWGGRVRRHERRS